MRTTVMLAAVVMIAVAAPAVAQDQETARALSAADAADEAASTRDALQQEQRALVQAQRALRQQEKLQAQSVREARDAERAARDAGRDRETSLFDQASSLMDAGRWDSAVQAFAKVAAMKASRADGALYWKAYSQDRLGQRAEALATIAELSKAYPSSRYLKQAQALDMEVRRRAGQPVSPDSQADEDLKLMAVNALMTSDPEKAIPLLEKLLQGPGSPRVRERAVFVLAQSSSPQARQILVNLARGSSTPDLQQKAVQYLGVMGSPESRATLADIYGSTTDVEVKRQILRAFMIAGEKQRLLTAARTEQNPDLRSEAVRQLGVMGAADELWQMYQKEPVTAVRKQILQAMFVGGHGDRMIELARTETDPELRATAVRNLGLMGADKTASVLLQIYEADKDPAVRTAVLNSLFLQQNASALVTLARKESDPAMKKAIVEKLSVMKSKVASDYMLELLK